MSPNKGKQPVSSRFLARTRPLWAICFAMNIQAVQAATNNEDDAIDWSLSYSYSPGEQAVLSDSSSNKVSANYHSLSVDGSRGDWSWGISAGKSKDDKEWQENAIDELASLSVSDRGFYLSRQFGDWSLSGNVNVSKSASKSLFTRHFPNRNFDYINVDVDQTIEFSELSLGMRLSYGRYLNDDQTWYFGADVATSFHDSESEQYFAQTNRVLVSHPDIDAYIRANPVLTPGILRSDEIADSNEFWSREASINLDRDVDFSSWLYSVSVWASYLHFGAPDGSLSYSRTLRGARPLSRSIKYDANEQLISADSIWYYGVDNYFTISSSVTFNLGVTFNTDTQAETMYSVGAQYWF